MKAADNSTYPKVVVQWFNQALCFYQNLVQVDTAAAVLRNRQLRQAENRHKSFEIHIKMSRKINLNILLLAVCTIVQSCWITYQRFDTFPNKESKELYKQAQLYQSKGNLDSALICFNKADKSAPNTPLILHERGLLKSDMENFEDALVDIDKSIELTTKQRDREIRILNRALTYMEMGNMTAACNDWKNSGKWGKSYIEEYCK